MNYIFSNTSPNLTQIKIGYFIVVTKSCPTNQLYAAGENLCYSLSNSLYYQSSPTTILPCPYSCYQCVGPLTTQCKSCVPGWNRVKSGTRCVCLAGFYDQGTPMCLNCTKAIPGCYTCNSATNCLTCLPECRAINFNPIYCDCPNHVNITYNYSCPLTFYY